MNEFPFRDCEELSLLVGGRLFYPRIFAALAEAENEILIEMYYARPGRIAEQLLQLLFAAVDRGVEVRLLLDAVGASEFIDRYQKRLSQAKNITVESYNPIHLRKGWANIFRDHRKLISIDKKIGFIGGAGIADEFDESIDKAAWHDLMIEIKGALVEDMAKLITHVQHQKLTDVKVKQALVRHSGDTLARLIASQGLGQSTIKRVILNQIRKARQRVWIATPYFFPPRSIRSALIKAARRGVDVRLLLPSAKTDHPLFRYAGQKFYARQLKNSVQIYEYSPRFIHSKAIICDAWASAGSFNLDLWSLRWNLEANIETPAAVLVSALEEMFERDFAQSRRYDYEQWMGRGLFRKLRENFAWMLGRIMMVLDKT